MSKIAVFFPKTHLAAWSLTGGLCSTLRRMGHEVTECPTPPAPRVEEIPQYMLTQLKESLPSLDALKQQDAILVSGPEHISVWIDLVYGMYDWKHVPKVPKAAWYHESSDLMDGMSIDMEQVFWAADHFFFPAIQDAEFYDQEDHAKDRAHWLPFGVDTDIFNPPDDDKMGCWCSTSEENRIGTVVRGERVKHYENCKGVSIKKWPVAFIGSVYGYRGKYLEALSNYEHPNVHIGGCLVQDLAGVDMLETARRNAANYRQIGVFFNLPSLSRLLVNKPLDVMACGTFVLAPKLDSQKVGRAAENCKQFQHNVHIAWYAAAQLAQTARMLQHWTKPENLEERERIAKAGCEEVHKNHRLDQRLTAILEKLGVNRLTPELIVS